MPRCARHCKLRERVGEIVSSDARGARTEVPVLFIPRVQLQKLFPEMSLADVMLLLEAARSLYRAAEPHVGAAGSMEAAIQAVDEKRSPVMTDAVKPGCGGNAGAWGSRNGSLGHGGAGAAAVRFFSPR